MTMNKKTKKGNFGWALQKRVFVSKLSKRESYQLFPERRFRKPYMLVSYFGGKTDTRQRHSMIEKEDG